MRRHREQDTVTAIVAFLRAHRMPVIRLNSGAFVATDAHGRRRFHRFGVTGMADIHVCLPNGRCCWLEVKSNDGRLTPEQTAFLAEHRKSLGLAFVVRSVDEVADVLKAHGYLSPRKETL